MIDGIQYDNDHGDDDDGDDDDDDDNDELGKKRFPRPSI